MSCRVLRQLIFLRKSDCLGCAVLLCLVCLFDLACFFLPSHLSLKHVHYIQYNIIIYIHDLNGKWNFECPLQIPSLY